MIQKKIAVLGAFAVGKTSLTERLVTSAFSERYHTTVGVRIHKKTMAVGGAEVVLIIWDLAGEDELMEIRTSYLRGSAGYLLVADGTRRSTLDKAVELQRRAEAALGAVPFVLALNKSDRAEDWTVDEDGLRSLTQRGWTVVTASAKNGTGVERAFGSLAGKTMVRK